MQREAAYLLDILEAAKLATQYVSEKSFPEFQEDVQCQDAVIRRLALIGEAARRVSAETRENHPQIPWKDMIAMRNLVIHQYDGIDLQVVWDTANQDLPPLIASLEEITRQQGELERQAHDSF